MSRYAWLVCDETKQFIWLGKICVDPETSFTYFHRGDESHLSNSADPVFAKTIMKFLGQHLGKTVRVCADEEIDGVLDENYVDIGGDGGNSIPMEAYVAGYKG